MGKAVPLRTPPPAPILLPTASQISYLYQTLYSGLSWKQCAAASRESDADESAVNATRESEEMTFTTEVFNLTTKLSTHLEVEAIQTQKYDKNV